MRKRLGSVVGALALTFALSSCWVMQSFVIGDYTLTPGQATKARFTLRPMGSDYAITGYRQFLIIGVSSGLIGDDTDIRVSTGRWGVNGQFGGPLAMEAANGIVTSLAPGDCAQSGLDFTDVTGHVWKAFATPTVKNDQGKVESKSVMEVTLKAKAAAVDVGENYSIVAVAGGWNDDGDGTPEPSSGDDGYVCWGLATGSVHVKAAA